MKTTELIDTERGLFQPRVWTVDIVDVTPVDGQILFHAIEIVRGGKCGSWIGLHVAGKGTCGSWVVNTMWRRDSDGEQFLRGYELAMLVCGVKLKPL